MTLTDTQKEAIKLMMRYPNEMIMHNGWLTGGWGVRIKLNTVHSLEKKGLVYRGKLTEKAKQFFNFLQPTIISSACGKPCDELRTACDKCKAEYYKWARSQPQNDLDDL